MSDQRQSPDAPEPVRFTFIQPAPGGALYEPGAYDHSVGREIAFNAPGYMSPGRLVGADVLEGGHAVKLTIEVYRRPDGPGGVMGDPLAVNFRGHVGAVERNPEYPATVDGDGEAMTPVQRAAAFHGLATNPAVPPGERLSHALMALDGYAEEVRRLSVVIERLQER